MRWVIEAIGNIIVFLGGLSVIILGLNQAFNRQKDLASVKIKGVLNKITARKALAILFGILFSIVLPNQTVLILIIIALAYTGLLELRPSLFVVVGINLGSVLISYALLVCNVNLEIVFLPMALIIGFASVLLLNKSNGKLRKSYGQLLSGVFLIFIGVYFMKVAVSPLIEMSFFHRTSSIIGLRPFLAIFTGITTRVLIQSDHYIMEILKLNTGLDVLFWGGAVYIIVGQNIGATIVPGFICHTTNHNGKRVAFMHVIYNVVGAVSCVFVTVFLFNVLKIDLANEAITLNQIIVYNLVYNLIPAVLLVIFSKQFIRFTKYVVPDKKNGEEYFEKVYLKYLEQKVLSTPDYAVDCAVNEVVLLGESVVKNIQLVSDRVLENRQENTQQVYDNEYLIDEKQKVITEYLVAILNLEISTRQKYMVKNLIYIVNDIEQIGNYCINIMDSANYYNVNGVELNEIEIESIKKISEHAINTLTYAMEARRVESIKFVKKAEKHEEIVEYLEGELRKDYVEHLISKECDAAFSAIYSSIISSYYKISKNAMNIASYVKAEIM